MSEVINGMKVGLIIYFLDYRKPPKIFVLISLNYIQQHELMSEVLNGMKVCLLNIFLALL